MKRFRKDADGKPVTQSIRRNIRMVVWLGILPLAVFGSVALFYISHVLASQPPNSAYVPAESLLAIRTVIGAVFGPLLAGEALLIVWHQRIVSQRIVQPVKAMANAFCKLQSGNAAVNERLPVTGNDEIGELGALINSFLDASEDIALQRRLERKLNEQNSELEDALEMLKDTQLQMVQQERLAAIGQLAAGVAHEINNPLGYVSGNADMLRIYVRRYEDILLEMRRLIRQGEQGGGDCAYLDEIWEKNKIDMVISDMPDLMNDITEGLKRIAAIVNGLRGFSRSNLMEGKSAYNINEAIQTTLLVANNEIKYYCDVALELTDVPPVYVNGGQINQVLLNIIINACHAIRIRFTNEKGRITIKTYSIQDKVYCSVRDNGCGMNEDVKGRIFEPFFTTKPVGQGTGLGLGIVYDILCKQHDGSIEVESNPGEGTCFVFALPEKSKEKL